MTALLRLVYRLQNVSLKAAPPPPSEKGRLPALNLRWKEAGASPQRVRVGVVVTVTVWIRIVERVLIGVWERVR